MKRVNYPLVALAIAAAIGVGQSACRSRSTETASAPSPAGTPTPQSIAQVATPTPEAMAANMSSPQVAGKPGSGTAEPAPEKPAPPQTFTLASGRDSADIQAQRAGDGYQTSLNFRIRNYPIRNKRSASIKFADSGLSMGKS
jgi:hypothetical protein